MATNVTATLQQALRELQAERQLVERRIIAIQAVLSSGRNSGRPARPARRQTWSAAARAAVSRRMRAYWAKRRAAEAKGKR
jgi:hypothetical protein